MTDPWTKRELVLAGLGWGGMPLWMIEDDLAERRLVELTLQPYPRSVYSLYAVRAMDRPYGTAASWLVDSFESNRA